LAGVNRKALAPVLDRFFPDGPHHGRLESIELREKSYQLL
jgi:hypothetical protein